MTNIEELRKRYGKLKSEPFKAVVSLGTPLVLGADPPMLDSILTYQVAAEVFGTDSLNRDLRQMVDIPLPLKRVGSVYPVWAASRGYFAKPYFFNVTFWTRRADSDYVTTSNEVILPKEYNPENKASEFTVEVSTGGPNPDLARGGFRNLYNHIPTLATSAVTFYGNGNIPEVKRLLESIGGLGADRNQGYGLITKVEVNPVKKDFSLYNAQKKPARPLPVADFANNDSSLSIGMSRPLPPYWGKTGRVLSYMHYLGVVADPNIEEKKPQKATIWDYEIEIEED